MNWTDAQREILNFDQPCDLLVSAAAGSGKTAVMTERIKKRTLDDKAEISEILVMTFTNYAAQSMRERIENSFRAALQQNLAVGGDRSGREKISRQILQLQQAQISTIHAFCIQILQTYGSELTDRVGVPLFESGFGVLDDTRRQILLDQAVDYVLNVFYEKSAELESSDRNLDWVNLPVSTDIPWHDDEIAPFSLLQEGIIQADWIKRFNRVCDIFSGKKDDSSLRTELTGQLNRLRSLGDYEQWARQQLLDQKAAAADFCESKEYSLFMEQLDQTLLEAEKGIELMKQCVYYDKLIDPDNKVENDLLFRELLAEQSAAIKKIRTIHDETNELSGPGSGLNRSDCKWDQIRKIASTLSEPVLLSRRGKDKKELATIYNTYIVPLLFMLVGKPDLKKAYEAQVEKPLHVFAADTAMIELDLHQMLPVLTCFFELVLLIDRVYLRLKIQEQAVDFSDFEHFALRLLRIKEIGASYRRQFKEIYLDEYQDINNIQESIIREIAQDNVFMVGDIKQSIYRFRFANPSLFNEKAYRFKTDPASGRLMTLNQNFRSVPGLLHGINRIFASFLTRETGEIDYDESQALVPFRKQPDENIQPIQLLLVNTYEGLDQNLPAESVALEDKTAEKEALAVVRQIKQLIEEDRCSYGDIAILGRTNELCSIYYEQLVQYGIPVTASGERTFLDSPELRLMESLINLLDNMQQDIPLASIMRSGLVQPGFCESELLEIRIEDHKSPERQTGTHFYAAVMRYAAAGTNQQLRLKVSGFLDQIRLWRQQEQYLGIAELIGQIYDQSGYPDRVSCLPFGESRVSDLERFQEWAGSFEQSRQRGLYEFARFIKKIREQKIRESGFDQVSSADDAVRIMTVHGSKGLEFPVVFLVGIQKDMTRGQSGQILQVSEHGGITSMSVNPDNYESHQTVSNYWHELASAKAERAEAYRLLYVGMTRAENRLYLVGNISMRRDGGSPSKLKLMERVEAVGEFHKGLPADLVSSAKSWLDLLLIGITCEKELDPSAWFINEETAEADLIQSNDCFKICLIDIHELRSQLYSHLPTLANREEEPLTGSKQQILSDSEQSNKSAAEDYERKFSENEAERDKLAEIWYQRLKPEYKHESTTQLPGKITVSGLKRLQEQIMAGQIAVSHGSEDDPDPSLLLAAGEYMPEINMELHTALLSTGTKNDKLTGAELGTMLHTIFQFLDLTALGENPGLEQIDAQIILMADQRKLPRRYLEQALKWREAVLSYARSDLAAEIRRCEIESPERVYREMPFTLALPLSDKPDLTLIQGMIDCWYESEEGVVLVDFKSDNLTGSKDEIINQLASRYGMQLASYAMAIERAADKKVIRKIIWLIRQGRSVEL